MTPLHVLIADDLPELGEHLAEQLRSNGHRVSVVTRGEDAVEACRQAYPDLILMDLEMPGIGGLQAIRQIRKLTRDHWIPIIVITESNDEGDVLQGFMAGGDDYLHKPVNPLLLEVRMRAMMRIASMQRATEAIVDNIIEGIVRIDTIGRITGFNKAAETIFGYEAKEVLGQSVRFLMPSPHREEHDTYIGNYLATGQAKVIGKPRKVQGLRKSGEVFPMQVGVSEISTPDGRSFIGLIRDLSDEEALQRQIEYQATHDQLTGLPNRYSTREHLQERFAPVEAGELPIPCSMFYCDLDGFKQVNDHYGHSIGDEVLRETAERLQATLFVRDFFSRIGGDEFILVVDGLLQDDQALQIAERLIVALRTPIRSSVSEHPIGVSIGISHSRNYDNPSAMINAADAAMYWAKNNGRNRAVIAR